MTGASRCWRHLKRALKLKERPPVIYGPVYGPEQQLHAHRQYGRTQFGIWGFDKVTRAVEWLWNAFG